MHPRRVGRLWLGGPGASTLTSANDRGYECLLLTDACAALAEQTRKGALSTVTMSGGIFGAVGIMAHLAAKQPVAITANRRRYRGVGPGRTDLDPWRAWLGDRV